jgi:hypothetical protein
MKKLYLTAICIFLFGCSGHDKFASTAVKEEIWCALNSNRTPVGSAGSYIEIQPDDVHVVPQKSQAAMRELLNGAKFLKISREMAKGLTASLGEQKEVNRYYLVRAAGLYGEESESFESLKFNVFYFPQTETLNVYFFGLATQATPKNVVILISAKHPISRVNSICEIAA